MLGLTFRFYGLGHFLSTLCFLIAEETLHGPGSNSSTFTIRPRHPPPSGDPRPCSSGGGTWAIPEETALFEHVPWLDVSCLPRAHLLQPWPSACQVVGSR